MDIIEQTLKPATGNDQLGIAPAELQKSLKLAGLLQTSMEIDKVLEFFLQSAQQFVSFDAANFVYEGLDLEIKFGKAQRHACSYRLRLAGESLGEISFTRRRRFAEQEMEYLENLIVQLIYPLRNAIWYQKALRAAKVDPLTGAYNRTAMDETLLREVELAHRHKSALALLVIDIDYFKKINDLYGHSSGDEVLREAVTCINQTLRRTDMLFRFGGEEFVLMLPGVNAEGARLVAERIRSVIEKHHFVSHDHRQIPITVSLGVSEFMLGDSAKSLFERADLALYQAKRNGRNRVAFEADNSPVRAEA